MSSPLSFTAYVDASNAVQISPYIKSDLSFNAAANSASFGAGDASKHVQYYYQAVQANYNANTCPYSRKVTGLGSVLANKVTQVNQPGDAIALYKWYFDLDGLAGSAEGTLVVEFPLYNQSQVPWSVTDASLNLNNVLAVQANPNENLDNKFCPFTQFLGTVVGAESTEAYQNATGYVIKTIYQSTSNTRYDFVINLASNPALRECSGCHDPLDNVIEVHDRTH